MTSHGPPLTDDYPGTASNSPAPAKSAQTPPFLPPLPLPTFAGCPRAAAFLFVFPVGAPLRNIILPVPSAATPSDGPQSPETGPKTLIRTADPCWPTRCRRSHLADPARAHS